MRDRDDLVITGLSAASAYHLGLVGSDVVDAYLPARVLPALRGEHALEPVSGPESNIILRAVPDDAWRLLDGRRFAPLAKVAIDLWSYPDPRAARIGEGLVADIDRNVRPV